MKILIDADGCPVVKQTVSIAKENKISVTVFCDTSHIITSDWANVIIVSKGADSVDFALVNHIEKGDIVITQDYGLSAMALSKGGIPITQNGLVINDSNLSAILITRYETKKARMSGKYIKGPKKRTASNDEAFISALTRLINENDE